MPIMQLYDKDSSTWQEVPALQGSAGKMKIGDVKTVPSTSPAKITNTGTSTDAVLDFEVPRGMDGITPVRGEDYWTSEDQQQIIEDVSEKLNYQFQVLMNAIQNKPVTYVFADKAELDSALTLSTNQISYKGAVYTLNPGDIFLLVSTDEPDYWFGEDTNGEKLHELDARKVVLTEYVKSSQFVTLTQAEYEQLAQKEDNVYYFIIESDVTSSSNTAESDE